MRPFLYLGLSVAMLAAAPPLAPEAAAQQPAAETEASANADAQLRADLDSIARGPVLRGQVAGLTAWVVRGADTLLAEAYGLGSVELHVPTPRDAVYEIGSVTKQFTAAALLKLADEGRVSLDADLTDYLPDYDTGGRAIPVRRLLDHTSGIMGYTEMPAFGAVATRMLPRDSLVALFEAEPLLFEPGTAQIYNNSAYFLAGLVIEAVTGASYEDYLREAFFGPLELGRTSYCSNQAVVPRKVSGYQFTPDGLMQGGYIDHTWPYAAGSLCSSAGDLVRWLRALHGGRALSDDAYRAMTSPATLADGTPLRYGYGLAVLRDVTGHLMIGHGGGIPGFVSDTRHYPESGLTVVVLINTIGPASAEALATALATRVLGEATPPAAVPVPDSGRFVGTYAGPMRGQREGEIRVATGEDSQLALQVGTGGTQPMLHIGDGVFRVGGQIVTFRPGTGRATTLELDAGGYAYYVMRRR